MYSLSGNTSRFSQLLIQEWDFALFPRDIKGNRIDDDDGLALFVSISHGIPGTAGASIPYCENIIGVIDHDVTKKIQAGVVLTAKAQERGAQ